jgi:hypothetical protein
MILVITLFIITLFLPGYLLAQGQIPPPPPPPNDEEEGIVPGEGLPQVQPVPVQGSVDTGAQVNISLDVLAAMGMSRSQFVDRLAAGMFAGDEVDLLIPTLSMETPHPYNGGGMYRAAGGDLHMERLVAVQVKRFYQIPRLLVGPEEIDDLEQIFITNGEVYLELNFRPGPGRQDR